MKWGVRNKTAEKWLVGSLLYAHHPMFFILLLEKYEHVLYCVKIQEKSLNLQIWI